LPTGAIYKPFPKQTHSPFFIQLLLSIPKPSFCSAYFNVAQKTKTFRAKSERIPVPAFNAVAFYFFIVLLCLSASDSATFCALTFFTAFVTANVPAAAVSAALLPPYIKGSYAKRGKNPPVFSRCFI